jgi:hypothetical protein
MNDHIPDTTKMINDGGPAFAFANGNIVSLGMTLRDYFAAAAINEVGWHNDINNSAAMAYKIADAMLKAREAK